MSRRIVVSASALLLTLLAATATFAHSAAPNKEGRAKTHRVHHPPDVPAPEVDTGGTDTGE